MVDVDHVEAEARCPLRTQALVVLHEQVVLVVLEQRVVDVAGPELGDDVRLVRDHLDLDGVDGRLALVPVVRVPARLQVALRHPLLQDERAGADGGAPQIALLDDLARQDRRPAARHPREQRGARLLGDDAHGVRVWRLDLVDRAQVPAAPRARLGVDDALVRELHVVPDELAPVVELHAAPQLERPRAAVRAGRPRFREPGLELAVVPPLDEAVVEQRIQSLAGERLLQRRIETGRLRGLRRDEHARGARLRRGAGGRGESPRRCGEIQEAATRDP